MGFVAGADMRRQRIGAGDAGIEILFLAGQFVEKDIADAQLAYLVGFDAAEEIDRHSPDRAAIVRIILSRGREGNARPCPVGGSCAVGQLMIEHRANDGDRLGVRGIGIPRDQRIDELPEGAGRISLPVGSLKRFGIVNRVHQINLQAAFGIVRHFVLHEIPGEMKHLVISKILFRLIPGEQLALCIHDGVVPRQFGIDQILLRRGGWRGQSRKHRGSESK